MGGPGSGRKPGSGKKSGKITKQPKVTKQPKWSVGMSPFQAAKYAQDHGFAGLRYPRRKK